MSSNIVLTEEQSQGKEAIHDWLKHRTSSQQVFKLFGLAGTGKTTLMKSVAHEIIAQNDFPVYLAAFTGKAAAVLRQKVGIQTSTIHSLIYQYVGKDKNSKKMNPLFAVRNTSVLEKAGLLIIDECSMVSKKIADDLAKWGIPILAVGDPGQLPPVNAVPMFTSNPDFQLTKIQRQAADNPIIRQAYAARNGQPVQTDVNESGSVAVFSGVPQGDWMAQFSQVLCGKHKTRVWINQRIRAALYGGEPPTPVPGDKIVCLMNDKDMGINNGELFFIKSIEADEDDPDAYYISFFDPNDEERWFKDQRVLKEHFNQTDYTLDMEAQGLKFDYGYALTVHKSQGSEWDHVLIVDDKLSFDRPAFRAQWMYTAITRAKQSVTVVLF